MPAFYAKINLDSTQVPQEVHHTIRASSYSRLPPIPELVKKNRSGFGLNLQELNRQQRRITFVTNC